MTFPIILLIVVTLVCALLLVKSQRNRRRLQVLQRQLGPGAATLTIDGHSFRDLNKNGRLDPYEDSRLPVEARVEDLLSQMTLEEKAGLMFHTMIGMKKDGRLVETRSGVNFVTTSEFVIRKKMNHFNLSLLAPLRLAAEWNNRMQKLAERTRLGIPITLSTDPRHGFKNMIGTMLYTEGFSHWPDPLGLAAAGDPALTRQFGDIARQEYLAIGLRVALHPMADLATEPRWARCNGTFGEQAILAGDMLQAYIRGFQGEQLGPHSVACMVKHFPGGGPQKDGEDPHFSYGRDQVYPGGNFDYHLQPFEAAFTAGASQVMPYYGRPLGLEYEQVGFGYNKDVVNGLLRGRLGFNGIVCTDWSLVYDMRIFGMTFTEAKAWGVEDLTPLERVRKVLEAGCDQFGGEMCPELVVELVRNGQVSEQRIDESARRILREKFVLGLFDDPYVDPGKVQEVAGRRDFLEAGELAQRRAFVLLKNDLLHGRPILPLQGRPRLYIENVDPKLAGQYGQVVRSPEQADYAILRLQAPYEKRKGFLERLFHAGDLDFKEQQREHILEVCRKVPTIVDIYLDRPAVLPEIAAACAGLLADFGAQDPASLDMIFGRSKPGGRLPFELPRSMEAVRQQKEDLPFDSQDPLFHFGEGLEYG